MKIAMKPVRNTSIRRAQVMVLIKNHSDIAKAVTEVSATTETKVKTDTEATIIDTNPEEEVEVLNEGNTEDSEVSQETIKPTEKYGYRMDLKMIDDCKVSDPTLLL